MSFSSIAVSCIVAYSMIGSPILHTATALSDTGNFLTQAPKTTKKPEQVKQLKPNPINSSPPQTGESPNQKLIQCLRRNRNSQTSQSNISGSDSIVSPNSGTGTGTGNSNRTANPTATPPKINTSNHSRAVCRNCNTQYPASARRRGIEGRVEIAVDTDAQGNVINTRIVRSSGNSDLDAETLRQAQNWKFKPVSNGIQGLSIGTDYTIAGSCRHRELQEYRRRRRSQVETHHGASLLRVFASNHR
ncbi:MAG: energy transducer TonB [Desmonostoc vinosum HA7617-LM4]|jgi:TonB family protein|nr:energy transducer TonB [Desmonostoc vinosum HA7617-LM4]